MAVNIPRLQEIQPSGSPSEAGRINMNVRDGAASILNRADQLTSLAGTAEKAVDKVKQIKEAYEDKKGEEISYENESDYSNWYNEELTRIKQITDADPTEAYNQLDINAAKKREEIINRRPDVSSRLKTITTRKLDKVMDLNRTKMLNQRGLQSTTYKTKLTKENLKSRINDLVASSGNVKPTGKSNYDTYLDGIENNLAKSGLDTGGTIILDKNATSWDYSFKDNDGKEVKVKYSDIYKRNVATKLDEGVTSSVMVLLDSGEKDQAALVYDKYKKYMFEESKAKYKKKLEKRSKSDDAYKTLAKIENTVPKGGQLTALNKIKDPEIKKLAIDRYYSNETKMAKMKKDRQDNFYKLAVREIDTMEELNQLNGLSDIEANQKIRGIWDGLSENQQKAIEQKIKHPKFSTSKAQIKIQDLFFGNDPEYQIETIPIEAFQEYMVDLNPSDQKYYRNQFESLRKIKKISPSEQRVTFDRAKKMLEAQFLMDEHIEPRNKYGRYEEDDEIELMKASKEMILALSDYMAKGPVNEKEMLNFVELYSKARIDERVFNPPKRKIKKEGGYSIKEFNLNRTEIFQLKKLYKNKEGKIPGTNSKEFYDFVKQEQGKK